MCLPSFAYYNIGTLQICKQEPLLNKKIKAQMETAEGRAMFCVVREFLEYFDLDFTISVFEPESYLGTSYRYEGRCKIIEDLGISELDVNTNFPILLQLIHLVKRQSARNNNSVSIHLNNIQHELNGTDSDFDNKSEKSKSRNNSESQNYSSISENLEASQNSTSNKKTTLKQNALNATFNLSSPTVEMSPRTDVGRTATNGCHQKSVDEKTSPISITSRSTNDDDTCSVSSQTSQKKEPSLIDLDKSIKLTDVKIAAEAEKQRYIIDESLTELEFSPPVLKESKLHSKLDTSVEKLKLSPQITEKLKPKNTLTSLADLPPLQITKSRSSETVILPSMCNKERASLKEIDKLLNDDIDSLDNYEEDFMSGSELDLSGNKIDLFNTAGVSVDLTQDFHRSNEQRKTSANAVEENGAQLDSKGDVKTIEDVSDKSVGTVASSLVSEGCRSDVKEVNSDVN